MDLTGARPNSPVLVFFGVMAISLAGLLLLPPILQDQNYHQFADQRTILGIPNFWNVVSNLPFLAGRSRRVAALSIQSGNHCLLPRRFSDRHRFVLLSLGSERRHPLLGPAADDAELRGGLARR